MKGLDVIAVVKLERCMTYAGIYCIILSKSGYWQKSDPIILFKIDKYSKVNFHSIICFSVWLLVYRWKMIESFCLNSKK